MKKEFVPYEMAKRLKELGFDGDCMFYWYPDYDDTKNFHLEYGKTCIGTDHRNIETMVKEGYFQLTIKAPLWQQAFDWLLHGKGINTTIDWTFYDGFHYFFKYTFPDGGYGTSEDFLDTPEEARYMCLKKMIELIKNTVS
jgi:hypothetical protein